ncbi:MAG TPA: hypothetical protein VFF04_03560 [Candidatus Babeliales bacterium]|nr:hypothetical protein [Candidatus Babeliales bacterium]
MENWHDLEPFTGARSRGTKSFISITARKSLTFSTGFIRDAKDQILSNQYVLLFFSKAKNAIVFEFTSNSSEKGALKMSGTINPSISSRSFFNFYKLDDKYVGKYIPKLEDIPQRGTRWVIYLDEKI